MCEVTEEVNFLSIPFSFCEFKCYPVIMIYNLLRSTFLVLFLIHNFKKTKMQNVIVIYMINEIPAHDNWNVKNLAEALKKHRNHQFNIFLKIEFPT